MIARDVDALIAFLDSRHRRRHRYGRRANDCVGFALAAVEAQTGVVVAPQLTWSTRAEARRVLAPFGSVEAAFDAFFERIAPGQAMRGDIAGVPYPDFGIHPMIVEGVTLVGPGEHGNHRLKREAMTCAWSAVRHKRVAA
jgi:hypothetical protein